MSLNTTVVIMNDSLKAIEQDPNFGKKLSTAIRKVVRNHKSAVVPALDCKNAASVVESHDAEEYAIIEVGHNHGYTLGKCCGDSAKDAIYAVANNKGLIVTIRNKPDHFNAHIDD